MQANEVKEILTFSPIHRTRYATSPWRPVSARRLARAASLDLSAGDSSGSPPDSTTLGSAPAFGRRARVNREKYS